MSRVIDYALVIGRGVLLVAPAAAVGVDGVGLDCCLWPHAVSGSEVQARPFRQGS